MPSPQELGQPKVWPGHFIFENRYNVDSPPALCNFQDLLKIRMNILVLRPLGKFSYIYINKGLTQLKLRLALRWERSKA